MHVTPHVPVEKQVPCLSSPLPLRPSTYLPTYLSPFALVHGATGDGQGYPPIQSLLAAVNMSGSPYNTVLALH